MELVVFAFDVEGTNMDRPIIGLMHADTDAPIVESKVRPELLLTDDNAKDRPLPRPVFAALMFAR